MLQNFVFYIFFVISLISIAHFGFYIVGANINDIIQFFRKKSETKPRRGRKYLPLVSVIVPAHNESSGIKRTLDSIRSNDYPNFEIIVVNDGSKDNTAKIVRDYIRYTKGTTKRTYYMARSPRTGLLSRHYFNQQVSGHNIKLVNQKN